MTDSVYEFRRYTLRPGRRDDLIELFDREFVETQDAVGAHVVAQYRDLGDADQFVWIRAFADMPSRRDALTAFYGGPVWKAHAAAANDTMIDVGNVWLLRPIVAPQVEPGSRGRPGKPPVTALLFEVDDAPADAVLDRLADHVAASLQGVGLPPVALWATSSEANDFPALPVRDVRGVVALVQHADRELEAGAIEMLGDVDWGASRPELLRLSPTERANSFAGHAESAKRANAPNRSESRRTRPEPT
jgi:quinol monooxygenase YgiN